MNKQFNISMQSMVIDAHLVLFYMVSKRMIQELLGHVTHFAFTLALEFSISRDGQPEN